MDSKMTYRSNKGNKSSSIFIQDSEMRRNSSPLFHRLNAPLKRKSSANEPAIRELKLLTTAKYFNQLKKDEKIDIERIIKYFKEERENMQDNVKMHPD
jgi:hypothetical protein